MKAKTEVKEQTIPGIPTMEQLTRWAEEEARKMKDHTDECPECGEKAVKSHAQFSVLIDEKGTRGKGGRWRINRAEYEPTFRIAGFTCKNKHHWQTNADYYAKLQAEAGVTP